MIPIIIFSTSMAVYLMTLAPTISFFDSGEMIAGAYTLGVAHPPGYPVYVTLGRLFTFLPLNSVAFRVNLMSSFFAAMTSVMIYYITRAMLDEEGEGRNLPGLSIKSFGIPEAAGILAAFSFSFSYNLWAWAVVSKFYTLNAFVVSCILVLLVRWRRARTDESGLSGHSLSYLYVISFVCGIALVVHISQLVLFPMYLLYILIVDWRVFVDAKAPEGARPRPLDYVKGVQINTLILSIFFFALGHSIYMHLPLRALQEPLINWGGATDWEKFRWVYNREGYPKVASGDRPMSLLWEQIKSFNIVREFCWAGLVLILAGVWGHFKKDWRNGFILLSSTLFMASVVVIFNNAPLENIFLMEQFYIPVYILLAVIMGGAARTILKRGWAAPWITAVTLAFIFMGDMPMRYLKALFTNNSGIVPEKTWLMGLPYPPGLYFVFFAAAVIAVGLFVRWLMKGPAAKHPALYLAVFGSLLIAYPVYQLDAHYWKNDRSKNYLAYDMGNSELGLAPQASVLFTWGDSGAFPMWYLQDVERKRPDVLLVHTPHLPLEWFLESIRREASDLGDASTIEHDYSQLKNYNGIKGIEQLLSMPEEFRDPAFMIKDIINMNPGREYAFDYSSRYSIDMPYEVLPYGLSYRKFDENIYVDENLRTWQFVNTRGLPNPTISLDLDETKAVSIYGYVHSDLGKKYRAMGQNPLAASEFVTAVKYAPDLWDVLGPYLE